MRFRLLAREASLLFFGTLAGYLAYAAVAGRLLSWITRVGVADAPPWLQVVVGIAALDGSKLLGLLAVAWVIGPLLVSRPWCAATTLLLAGFALELTVNALLQQLGGLWTPWPLAAARLLAAASLLWPLAALLRRRRPRSAPGA